MSIYDQIAQIPKDQARALAVTVYDAFEIETSKRMMGLTKTEVLTPLDSMWMLHREARSMHMDILYLCYTGKDYARYKVLLDTVSIHYENVDLSVVQPTMLEWWCARNGAILVNPRDQRGMVEILKHLDEPMSE